MRVRFITPIYNINVNKEGEVSFDILVDEWTPANDTLKVLMLFWCVLGDTKPVGEIEDFNCSEE